MHYLASAPGFLVRFAGKEFSLVERFDEDISMHPLIQSWFKLLKRFLNAACNRLVVAFDAQKIAIIEHLENA
jgi:hypothetical protein